MMIEPNAFINGDCMDYLLQYPDNYFDLAIVDPPYGDAGGGGTHLTNGRRKGQKPPMWMESVRPTVRQVQNPFSIDSPQNPDGEEKKGVSRTGGTWASKYGKKIITWDVAPADDYFKELFRVSKNQIIWGGTISTCHLQDALLSGAKRISRYRDFPCHLANMRGLPSKKMPRYLNTKV